MASTATEMISLTTGDSCFVCDGMAPYRMKPSNPAGESRRIASRKPGTWRSKSRQYLKEPT
jgi:hypothetical protein